MRVLMIKTGAFAEILDIKNPAEEIFEILGGDDIQTMYAGSARSIILKAADDEEQSTFDAETGVENRYIEETGEIIFNTFLLCGCINGEITDLPDDLMKRYLMEYYLPEIIVIPYVFKVIIDV